MYADFIARRVSMGIAMMYSLRFRYPFRQLLQCALSLSLSLSALMHSCVSLFILAFFESVIISSGLMHEPTVHQDNLVVSRARPRRSRAREPRIFRAAGCERLNVG